MYSLDDTDELGANAPKPIDSASIDRGAFEKLSREEGAVRARRDSKPRQGASPRHASGAHRDAVGRSSTPTVHLSRRMLVGLIIAAVGVIALCIALFVRVLNSPVPGSEELAEEAALAAAEERGAEPSNETTYELRETNGSYSLVMVRSEDDGQEIVVGKLPGKPVDLIMYGDTVLMPENLSDGTWQVSAYSNDGSWTPIMSQDGTKAGGKGVVGEASLDGSTLRLVVDGTAVEVPLEW